MSLSVVGELMGCSELDRWVSQCVSSLACMADELDECMKCGAAVFSMAKHRRWHEALDQVAPGMDAAMERILQEQQAKAYPARRLR